MKFAHRAWVDRHKGGTDVGRGGEGGWIDYFDRASAGDREGFLLREVVGVLGVWLVGGASWTRGVLV